MSFPLYENLNVNLSSDDLSATDKEFVVKYIKKADSQIHERIYALIRCFQLRETRNLNIIPFEGKASKLIKNQSNITFDLEIFPIQLKQILFKFCKLNQE